MSNIDVNILLRYMVKQSSNEECSLVDGWLNESEVNREEFNMIKRIYFSSREIYAFNNIEEDKSWKRLKLKTIDKKKNLRIKIFYGVAAVLIPFIIVLGFLKIDNTESLQPQEYSFNENLTYAKLSDGTTFNLLDKKHQEIKHPELGTICKDSTNLLAINHAAKEKVSNEQVTIVTPKGEQYDFVLPDGSKVILNSMSKLSYPVAFNDDIREVSLEGEAFLDVSKDSSRPFIVKTKYTKVKVLGTNFNVRAYANEKYNEITLVEGSVRISNDKDETVLVPGNQAVCSHSDKINVNNVDVNIYTSWTHGVFEFNKMDLQKITNSLERWYNVEFCFADKTVVNKRFTGAFKKGTSIEAILEFIGETTNVKFIKKKNIVYVVKKESENDATFSDCN